MADPYLIAISIEGVVLLCLTLVVLAHSRLLGLLHMRLGPAGARPLADGPAIGTVLGTLTGKSLEGSDWELAFPRPADTILVFLSPQCETCNALIPHVQDFVRMNAGTTLHLVSTIDHGPMNRAYVAYRRISNIPYVLGEALAKELGIEATPYALRIDAAGVMRAKGVVNTYENLVLLSRQDAAITNNTRQPSGLPDSTVLMSEGESDEAMAPGQ